MNPRINRIVRDNTVKNRQITWNSLIVVFELTCIPIVHVFHEWKTDLVSFEDSINVLQW